MNASLTLWTGWRTLQVLGVHDILGFEFIDPPSTASISDALKHLYMLGALDDDGASFLSVFFAGVRMIQYRALGR